MKQLLESEELRKEPRVIEAYRKLTKDDHFASLAQGLGDIAFQMRDACVENKLGHEFSEALYEMAEPMVAPWWVLTKEQWIIAATLVWEQSNE